MKTWKVRGHFEKKFGSYCLHWWKCHHPRQLYQTPWGLFIKYLKISLFYTSLKKYNIYFRHRFKFVNSINTYSMLKSSNVRWIFTHKCILIGSNPVFDYKINVWICMCRIHKWYFVVEIPVLNPRIETKYLICK